MDHGRTDSLSETAPLLVSFLLDRAADDIEKTFLDSGARVLIHCEYTRLRAPLKIPGINTPDPAAGFLAAPNCTTAICAMTLFELHMQCGVRDATNTTLHTDLPGMHAHAIHDQVIGHLEGEADSLTNKLRKVFDGCFEVSSFATRVPVWRGHTIQWLSS